MSGDHATLIGAIAGALCCTSAFNCNLAFDKYGGILLWIALMLYMFKALGTICDEYFVPSLEVIVDKLQLSNDVAGATFMAAGSSAPELFTSLVATFLIVNEGGVGTIVGSAIFNILVIVGATGVIACKERPLAIWWYPLCRDCFFYTLSIVELMIVLSDEHVEWYEGVIMILTYLSYCVYMTFNPQIVKMLGLVDPRAKSAVTTVQESASQIQVREAEVGTAANGEALRAIGVGTDGVEATQPEMGGTAAPGVVTTGEEDIVKDASKDTSKDAPIPVQEAQNGGSLLLEAPKEDKEKRRPSWGYAETKKEEQRPAAPDPGDEEQAASDGKDGAVVPLADAGGEARKGFCRDPLVVFWELTMPTPEKMGGGLLFALSIFFIGMCTYLMVDATNRVGVVLHIPPLAMALVFLAAGTSIPDALGSIAVAKQGEGDMAVANALGSNVFDILVGLGVPWTIKAGFMGETVSFPGKWDELIYDIVVLILVLFLFVGCLIVHGWFLTRKVGFLLLAMYVGFIIYNIFAIWVIDPPLKQQAVQGKCDVI